jgi:hypothetical protein
VQYDPGRRKYVVRWREDGRQRTPAELRRRVDVALVGRATGPFRNQLDDWDTLVSRRLDQAERRVADVAPMLRDA